MNEISVILAQGTLRREKLLARALAQMQSINAEVQIRLRNADINISNCVDEPHTSPEDHTVRGRLLESSHGTDDPKDELISPEKLKFTEAISKAMAKELAPLIANRDQTAVRPTLYRGSKDGTVEEWLLVMKRYLERVFSNASPVDKAWAIIDHLGDEARSFIMTTLLSSRFGTGSSRGLVRQAFGLRNQLEKEGLMQYLDALEGLSSQGFPDEPITTRRYEILHRFKDGVSDPVLQRELTVVFATEGYLADPPTVESLRFTVQELQRSRHQQQPRDPGCTETVPYQYLQSDQVPGSPVAPQYESLPPHARRSARLPMPAASVHTTPEYRQTATLEQSARCLQSACARRKLVVHCPEHILDPHSESQQGAAAAVPAPAVPWKSCTTEVSAGCPTLSIQSETFSPRAEEKKKPDATQTLSTASGRVLMLRPADQATVNAPLTLTCGTKQVQTGLEPTTFDPSGRTLLSVHLVLASEQQIRPDLTLEKLKLELASNPAVKRISLPLPKEWYTEGEDSTCTAYSPVPVHANIVGVDMKFDASVVVDVFPQGVCLGPHELRCYSISKQELTGEARIDERALLVVSFAVQNANPILLRGMVDTGSGVSIMSFAAFNRVALRTGVALQPYRIDLYAANGKTIKTFGIAERVRFQLGGNELETNFVVVDDAQRLEDFLLGRSFLRAYNVFVDLTAMKIVVRAPAKPVWHHAHAQTSDEALSSTVVLDQDVVLQPFERAVLRAKLVTSDLEAFAFRNVVINFATPNRLLKNTMFVEDTIATVGETGSFYVSVGNLTSNAQKVKCGTMLGTAAPVRLVYHAVPQCALAHKGKNDEKSDSPNEFVNRVYSEMDLNSHSKCSSSSEFEFLSSTDPSEEGLSEREIRKRTDPDLFALIPRPESQLEEVQKLWGQFARDSLNNILTEFDDLFLKHKADIGRCTIAKHPVELEPGATSHREGARRMSPDKAERANQEVRNLLALGMIQPSLAPWASGIVTVKKKNGELRFCCDFRPLNAVTIKDAYPLPRIDESLSRLGEAKIYTSIDLAWAFWQIPVRKADRQKTAFACELGLFEWRRMPFGMCNASAIFQRAIAARALRKIVNREGSMVMAYIDDIVIATETVEDHRVRLREVFECLREAGFKMRVAKCDFRKSEIKYLGRVVSAEGIKSDPKAVAKLSDWEVPRNKTEMQSFLGFANYYREFIPWHAKLVCGPLACYYRPGRNFRLGG